MEKKKIIIWLVVLAVVVVYVLWPYIMPTQPSKQPVLAGGPASLVGSTIVQPDKASETIITDQNERLTDPFALRVSVSKRVTTTDTVKGPAEPELQGIWVSAKTRVAFISGQSVNIGGVVLGWKVTGITKTKVYLTKGGITKTLVLEAQE